jgi:uncharacterized protein (TIGR02646 family)
MRAKIPTDGHWRDEIIRNILIADFKKNCGYCGCSRPTPRATTDNPRAPRGHVDHYRAKAIYPELTYEWANYIWSCEACNVEKGEFDDPSDPILNPCELDDCNQLEFIIDTGEYCLIDQHSAYSKRFSHTDQSTMLNANEFSIRRRNRVKSLINLFISIAHLLESCLVEFIAPVVSSNIQDIKNSLEDPEFYFLVKRNYQALRSQYPQVAELIDSNSH